MVQLWISQIMLMCIANEPMWVLSYSRKGSHVYLTGDGAQATKMPSLPVSALVCTWVLVISSGFLVDGYVEYKTKCGVVAGKLNVHLVAHSHDDLGWLKTINQYYVGSNSSIQTACVENILDSVVYSLRGDPNRKFVVTEMIGEYIAYHGGVVTADKLAPYLDLEGSDDRGDDSYTLPVCSYGLMVSRR